MFNEYIRSRQNEIVTSVLESVKINSVESEPADGMPFGKGVNDALEHALELAEKMGFRTVNADGYFGYAEYGEGEEMVAVLGHLDIVPVGVDWSHDPWGEICGEKIYGRGTLDDKGCIIGALYALDAVRELAGNLDRRVRIIFGTNEETGSRDMVKYNEIEESPAMGFTPDADYPVIFSEKGIARITLEKKITDGSLSWAKGGTTVNIVPAAAEIKYTDADGQQINMSAEGIPAHGSTPEQGKNAIAGLMKKIRNATGDLQTFAEFYNNCISEDTTGIMMGIACTTEKFGSTTVNAGLLEGNGEHIKVTLDCRYPATENFLDRVSDLTELAAGYGIECSLIKNVEPLYVPEDSVLVRTLQAVYKEQTGDDAEPVVIGGGTYAKSMKNIVAFGPVFPGQESVIHQKDEYISVEHLMKNVEIMAHAIYRLGMYTF